MGIIIGNDACENEIRMGNFLGSVGKIIGRILSILGSGLDVSYSDDIVRSFIYLSIKQKFYFTKIKIIHEVAVKPEPIMCSKFYRLFLPALLKKLPNVLILFSYHDLLAIAILFFMLSFFRY